MSLNQTYIDETLGNIQTLHGRFGNEICNMLKRRTGNPGIYNDLLRMNNFVGKVKDILYDYTPIGDTDSNDAVNDLSEVEIMSLINYCYKVMNKYNSNVFLPNNPNVYL